MVKILLVFGTRPEAIKVAPVIKTLERFHDQVELVICVTSQHREMLDQALNLFDISPNHNLHVMTNGQSLMDVTTDVLRRIEHVLSLERPDLVLVQGDTTTTFAASLAAFYQKISVGHIEAGLRTFQRYQPFPEEINRKLITTLTSYHYVPTEGARLNLLKEGISDENIVLTGNTGIDALLMTLGKLRERPQTACGLGPPVGNFTSHRLILVTAHRRENFGSAFEDICHAIVQVIKKNPDVVVIYPVHPNPNVRLPAHRFLCGYERIMLTDPLDYIPMVQMLARAHLILTDSGGLQEEAPALGKPVLVMRDVTERPEAIAAGAAKLVGTKAHTIADEVQKLLDDPAEYQKMAQIRHPFGDGRASERIVQHILERFSSGMAGSRCASA